MGDNTLLRKQTQYNKMMQVQLLFRSGATVYWTDESGSVGLLCTLVQKHNFIDLTYLGECFYYKDAANLAIPINMEDIL